jgi:hyperosmotically inducible periplasmic protein
MFRALVKLVLVIVIVVAAAAFLLGWWGGGRMRSSERPAAVGTAGKVDASRAREVGAQVGQKTADVANRAEAALSDGALTAKIKSKMALDDLVQARSIDVTTDAGVVTLKGTVRSAAEHDRAVQLTRETAGVKRVVDHLTVER